jgi:peptidoglycan/xylan/chitin deacetylase (PgdA/CDA1 family)
MFWRLVATVFAAALVSAPSMRAGLDAGRLLHPSASAAEVSPSACCTPTHARSTTPTEAPGQNPDDVPVQASAFGFGPKTGFFPSDGPRELVLSFDDGPDLKFTPLVLDELDRRGLKAIFFITGHRVVGDRAEDLARRELLGKMAAHGHLVANHTMTHRDLCKEPDEAAAEIDDTAEVITQATGVRPLLFRAPYGARCRTLEAALAARELVSVGWNLDPQDWRNPSSDEILNYLESRLSRLKGRGILLIHDTHPASVFALGPLLDWIGRENRRAVIEGQSPIVLRDYSVFLPDHPMPRPSIVAVAQAVVTSVARGVRLPTILAGLP